MADPIVHVTNGVPDAGTGNITTLGQTLLDGANIVYGATTDLAVTAGAAGTVSAKLRSISRDIVGGIVLQSGANVIGAVTQSGGPWSVSGTLAATQSGAWNITNITGTVSLPTGAATAANQPTNVAIGATTAGQTGHLAMGATTTAAPSYTTLQSNPLSLTTAGALRVDGSGVTQPISGTISVSGTVGVTQSGVWTVQPGNTANTTPWLMTINQGGNAATVSAAGALKVDGSATTQPVSAVSLPLPSGAATAANQPSVAAQASTTLGQSGTLVEAAATTSAPSYTNGTTNPLSLTLAGAIRVDASATTQPISGTVTANQGGTWNQRLQDGSGNAISSDARGTARPLAVEILDASGNQITSFGAGSGPSFGAAFPTTGQAIGVKDSTGTNMVSLNANASGALKVDGSAVTQPVSGTFWQATQPVSGTFWQATQPVSAVSLPLPTGASTSANQPSNAAVGSTTSGQTGTVAFAATTTSPPAYTTGQSNPLSLTTGGLLRVDGSSVTQPISGSVSITGTVAATQSGTWNINNVSGTVSLPTGAATSANQPTAAALASTTLGQTGTLSLGAVTTAAPSYTTATTNALSLTTAGALRTDASATTQPISGTVTASQGGTWTVQPGNTANTTPWLMTIQQGGNAASVTASSALKVDGSAVTQPISGTITANQGGNWTSRIVGNAGGIVDFAGQNASAPANSLLIGGEFNTTPTTITSGNVSPLQLDNAGNLLVNIKAGGAAGGTSSSFGAAIPATGTAAGYSDGTNMQLARVFDGDSGAGTQYSLGVLLKTPASGGAVDIGVAGQPIRVDPTGTTAQPVTGTFWQTTQPVSGTVTANQGGAPWTVKPDGTVWTLTSTSANVNVTNASIAVTGTFWQATQPISAASLPLPTGAATSANQPTNAALGSTTSGQTGNLAFGAVTTGAPAYTTATTNSLSLTTAGALRVDGSAVTQPVSGTFWQATQPVSGTVAATQSGNWTSRIVGNAGAIMDLAGQNAAAPANSLLIAGEFNTTPTTITSGNASPLQLDNAGNLLVNIKAGAGSGGTSSSFNATFPTTGTAIGAEYLSSPPTLTTGQMVALQTNINGALKIDGSAVTQPVSGTFWQATQPISAASLPLPTGASTSANQATAAAIGSTTSGETGTMAMGAVTTAAPSYTTAQTNPLSLTTAGALRVDGSAVTQPVSGTFWQATQPVSGTVTANQGGTWNITNISGTISLPTGAATSANQPTSVAAASTTSGQTGTLAYAAVVTGTSAYANATSQPLNLDAGGNLKVNTIDPASYNAGTGWTSATGVNTVASLLSTTAISYDTIIGQITQTTTITGGQITFEESFDNGATFSTLPPQRFVDPITYLPLANPYVCAPSTNQKFHIIPSGTGQIRARLSTVIAGTGTVTVSWTLCPITAVELTNSICAGDTPSGTADGGWPIKIGAVARTANPAAVTTGQRVNLMADKLGKLVAVGALRDVKGVQKTSITTGTETTVVTAGAAGVFNDVYAIVVTNKSATSVFVDFKDATAGTTRMTLAAPANDTRGFTVPVDSAMVQAVAANNWTATVSTAVTSIEITMLYTQNI